jgi:stress-induced morphogen
MGIAEDVKEKVESSKELDQSQLLSERNLHRYVLLFFKILISLPGTTEVHVHDFSDDVCNGAKLKLIVVSDSFRGKPPLQRHRLVNDCVAVHMPQIHALTIKTWTPAQYESKKSVQES